MLKINNPSAFNQYFRDLKDKLNRKLFNKYTMPWMKTKELDIIIEVVVNLKPEYVLEWGSGYSTLLFPPEMPQLKKWISVEHNADWYKIINEGIDSNKVDLKLIEPNNLEFDKKGKNFEARREGLLEDFKEYVAYPGTLGQKFDFIFIDGRARRHCLLEAASMLSEQGVLIVHDANRESYFEEIPSFKNVFHLQDYRKRRQLGGIWVGTNRESWSGLLRTELHKKAWSTHDVIAKILFLK